MKDTTQDNVRFLINEQSFEWLYNHTWEKLYSLCVYRVGDSEIAKELVQEVFFSIWERKDVLIITGAVEHYLMRSVKLKILEYFRTAELHKAHLGKIAQETQRHDNSTENYVLHNELVLQVQQYIATLPQQCRKVYELSRFNGLSTREIADEMVLSEKTVKNHLTRALASLKARILYNSATPESHA